MNSGLQDAFNLAWKLALVSAGHSAAALLDSYEAERRPVAEMITSSGDAFEDAQGLTDPAARRARDESLRAVFADPASRHHEAIAEAELDIDYGDSPIVMGDRHDALAPGHRLPDTIEVCLAGGETCLLHELAHRAGHTALVIGGPQSQEDELARLDSSVRTHLGKPVVEASCALSARPERQPSCARLAPAAADRLGIERHTLLIVRPDGHVGLRADRDHLEALAAYHRRLASGRL